MTEPDSSGPSGLADSVFFGGKEQKEAENVENEYASARGKDQDPTKCARYENDVDDR